MYFAGHMVLSLLLNRGILKGRVPYSLPLLFSAAMLPDLDFLLYPIFSHHTITHSIPFWAIIYLPVLAIFRIRALPYFIATFSHFVIGDIITGNPPLLYGFSSQTFGLVRPWIAGATGDPNSGMLFQAIVDAVLASCFVLYALKNRKGLPGIFSGAYKPSHVLVLGATIFAIFLGAYRVDMVHGLKTQLPQDPIVYVAVALLVAAQLAFFYVLAKGVRERHARHDMGNGAVRALPKSRSRHPDAF